MSRNPIDSPGVNPPLPYLQRIRDYYQALGYGAPYEWAHQAEVPFQPLRKPLSGCRIALVTTAAPYQADKGDQGPGAPYNALAKFYAVYSGDSAGDPDLRISHLAIDRQHTTAEDPRSYFPLAALRACAAAGRIGTVAPRLHTALRAGTRRPGHAGVLGLTDLDPRRHRGHARRLHRGGRRDGRAGRRHLRRHPILCARMARRGVAVFPGDVIVVDDDGAVLIPANLLDEMLALAPEQERLEAWIMGQVEQGAALPGLYPPSAENKARYLADSAKPAS